MGPINFEEAARTQSLGLARRDPGEMRSHTTWRAEGIVESFSKEKKVGSAGAIERPTASRVSDFMETIQLAHRI